MKRVCAVVCGTFLTVLLMAGCGKGGLAAAKPVTAGFSCGVTADYRGMAVKGTLSRTQDGRLRMHITQPPTLSGMVVNWDGKAMTMELGGMQVPVNAAKVPQGALVKSLLSVLTAAPKEGEMTDDGYVLEGEVDGKAYTIVCAPDTGLIRSLRVPEDELTVTFENTALLN